ncbi:hypothetical protein [Azospirillum sp. SYSU D00513]|uniref:hypothetical protein n=1 Tax=Azospirillum sp. SYSU D00513 TaxID=2812561 RepID=UPI001A97C1B2|nr:hypothetical protein [Azospirillum sp. SYSU D00513]
MADAANAEAQLGPWFDDLYIFSEDQDGYWKWRHGDRMIAAWHRDRGHALPWDTIVIVQWDMLLLAPLKQLFAGLAPDQLLLSGLRSAREVESWWGWLEGSDPVKRQDRDAFRAYLAEAHGYRDELLCCLFIVACLPRRFLDLYVAAGPPLVGFLEYKLPTMARVFGMEFCTDHPYRPWWASNPATRNAPPRERLLNAVGEDIAFDTVLEEMGRPDGLRIIHPYRRPFPNQLPTGPAARALRKARRLREWINDRTS